MGRMSDWGFFTGRGKVLEPYQSSVNGRLCNFSTLVEFGRCEQGSGLSPILWRIEEVGEGMVALVSNAVLDIAAWGQDSLWKDSEIRKWLNEVFWYTAFSPGERSSIKEVGGDFVTLPEVLSPVVTTPLSRAKGACGYWIKSGEVVGGCNLESQSVAGVRPQIWVDRELVCGLRLDLQILPVGS